MIRSKIASQKEERIKQSNVSTMKKMEDEREQEFRRTRYDYKNKAASLRYERQEVVKNEAMNFNRMVRNMKSDNVRKVLIIRS